MAPNVTRAASLRPNPNPIDTDVKVPEAVKRAAAAAEAAQAAAYPGQTPNPEPAPTPNADGIVIAPPGEPAAPVTPPGNEPAPAPTPPPAPPAPPAEDSWEHKFNSERGRRVKLEEQLRAQADRMTSMEHMIQDLRAAPAPTATPPAAPTRLITDQEESEFGTEMLDVMGRRAREIVSPEVAELRAQLANLENRITGTATAVKRSARQEMLSMLDRDLSTWRQINDMPEFKTWLALPDPYFGAIRHNALLQAFEQNDTPRVLNFFKGFVSELAASTPADELPVNPPAAQPAKPSLETLAAPGRARTPAQVNVPAEKQIITTADINAFYAAKARGAYNGREAEFAQLEQELFRAQREGRVQAV